MALTSQQKQEAFRKRQAELGRKEVRGIYATPEEEKIVKKEIRETLKKLRN